MWRDGRPRGRRCAWPGGSPAFRHAGAGSCRGSRSPTARAAGPDLMQVERDVAVRDAHEVTLAAEPAEDRLPRRPSRRRRRAARCRSGSPQSTQSPGGGAAWSSRSRSSVTRPAPPSPSQRQSRTIRASASSLRGQRSIPARSTRGRDPVREIVRHRLRGPADLHGGGPAVSAPVGQSQNDRAEDHARDRSGDLPFRDQRPTDDDGDQRSPQIPGEERPREALGAERGRQHVRGVDDHVVHGEESNRFDVADVGRAVDGVENRSREDGDEGAVHEDDRARTQGRRGGATRRRTRPARGPRRAGSAGW